MLHKEIQDQAWIDLLGAFDRLRSHFNVFVFGESVAEFIKELDKLCIKCA
jgi:hypothetical protein